MRVLMVTMAALIGGTAFVAAQSSASLGTFQVWNAYASNEADGKICYISSQPTDSKYSQNISGRDPAFFMVTSIPAKSIRNEASTIIGYPFQQSSKVTVEIDGTKFTMFTDRDSAWIDAPAQEPQLIEAMKAGTRMTVEGTSSRGTTSTDTYSLSGVSAALAKIASECP